MDIRIEATKAIGMLSERQQKMIRPTDAAAIVRSAVELKTSDGLIDGAIDAALQKHDILQRPNEEQRAYREMLTNVFLFGDAALEARRQRRAQESRQ